MIRRLTASVVLGAAVLLGTTGCNLIAPQGTLIQYSPSDGVNIDDSTPLEVRNAMVIANADGSLGNFVAAVYNPTDAPLMLKIEVGPDRVPARLPVPANSVVSLGVDSGREPLLIAGLNTPPGANVEIYFQSGDVDGVVSDVPVLDGTLPYYADLVPAG